MTRNGYGFGVLVDQYEGRPIKIEGNPLHPSSLGASDAIVQASLLTMYDPDRGANVINEQEIATWDAFWKAARSHMDELKSSGGNLRILSESISSPATISLIEEVLAQYPGSKWVQYDGVNRDNVRKGAESAFGVPYDIYYDFSKADVIVCLDADFMSEGPGSVRYIADFTKKRKVSRAGDRMNRLYAFETMPSLTGAMADHRLPLKPSDLYAAAFSLASQLGVPVAGGDAVGGNLIEAAARDLQAHRGKSLVMVGEHMPAELHHLAHLMNAALGNLGQTVLGLQPIIKGAADQTQELKALVAEMSRGDVASLWIFGGNPAYDAPGDIGFAEAMTKVPFIVRHGMYRDETGRRATWYLPESHFLESWGDAVAHDGTISFCQPIIEPLHESRSALEVVAGMLNRPWTAKDALQRHYWGSAPEGFSTAWAKALHDGVYPHQSVASVTLTPGSGAPPAPPRRAGGLELNILPDPSLHDGRWANNGWLQELPRPMTKTVWDNFAIVSVKTAEALKIRMEEGIADMATLTVDGVKVDVPVWVMPGHADDAVTVHLGYGRDAAGTVGNGVGFNAYKFKHSARQGAPKAELVKTGKTYLVAQTQQHFSMDDGLHVRDILRTGTLAELAENPDLHPKDHPTHKEITLYNDKEFLQDGDQWAMTVDLNLCVGCNACVIACQAENNIPVVGKAEVRRGREMHWIRIDRYHGPRNGKPTMDNPSQHFMPVMCQHCESAPCEPVCPVAATVHSHEGLNQMVYNRCVGTRYCSNNCPYKVRRFNYYNYTDNMAQFSERKPLEAMLMGNGTTPKASGRQMLKLLNNPEVTVRGRGVMEKCTYCVQRINQARIQAKIEGRPIKDGEIVTACQQACPSGAIVFGNMRDKESKVYAIKNGDPRNYGILTELNTKPRTTYLGKVSNPNGEVKA
jgi:molybdopterin-containing oxidoreductase family iron-sulfur binding subunit